MLSLKNRLKKQKDIAAVFRLGRILRSDFLFLKYYFNPERKSLPTRLAFAVSTKYSKKATERNYLKRLLRETTRKNLPKNFYGIDGVFFLDKSFCANKNMKMINYAQIEKQMQFLLIKINFQKKY